MPGANASPFTSNAAFKRWFFAGQVEEIAGPHEQEGRRHEHSWWPARFRRLRRYFWCS
jgi:hypothetical protein